MSTLITGEYKDIVPEHTAVMDKAIPRVEYEDLQFLPGLMGKKCPGMQLMFKNPPIVMCYCWP